MPKARTLAWIVCAHAAWGAASLAGEPPVLERDVLPILRTHCLKCHGPDQRKGGLSLASMSAMLEGGDSGPALAKGNAAESLLIEKVKAGEMPPGKAPKLTPSETATLEAWIAGGATSDGSTSRDDPSSTGPSHWAFRPPARLAIPSTGGLDRAFGPIDAFLLERLGQAGLTYSPEADRRALIRRATFDVWGLPPTPDEVESFLHDEAPDAYERLIERLLASPRYGERWGRHWLDVAGYADSEGILAADHARSASWRYRDWVVRVFNADLPYDRFLREQLAGDEFSEYWSAYETRPKLPGEVVDSLVATGFLRLAGDTSRPDFVNIKNAPGYYYQTLDDTLKIVASATLGLTLQCAKCHSHKYDPITQTEYYRIQSVFMSGYRPAQWVPQVERRRWEASAAEEADAKAHNAVIDQAIARREGTVATLTQAFAERRFAARLATLPEPIRDDTRRALDTAPAKRDEVQRYLASKFEADLRPPKDKLPALLVKESPREQDLIQSLRAANAADAARRRVFPEIRAFYDLPGEPKTPILQRGDYLRPGPEVGPGVLRALAAPQPFRWAPPPSGSRTSGRRKAFAEWLTQPGHPLASRVLVNRVWLHHFGEGIVSTPDNFGLEGSKPSHPELLDWLATEFERGGWSIKGLHRMIMRSTAYRQSSRFDPTRHEAAARLDPEDRLLWRQRMRRLEGESLRDTILCVSGSLAQGMGGPPVPMQSRPDGEIVTPDGPEGRKRSIYLQVRRSQPLTLLQVFDQPVMETNCARRPVSTVSSQALELLNSTFLVRQAERLAERVAREAPSDSAALAVELTFGRPATPRERGILDAYLTAQGSRAGRGPRDALVDVCHMLLSSNEFAYVD